MFNFLFKTGTYLLIWKKFKTQIISILFSILFIWLIFGIYDDLIRIFELKDTSILLSLLAGKWFFIFIIVFYNIRIFKTLKQDIKENDKFVEEKIDLPIKSQEVLEKKDILTTTDLILKKYKNENN
jgi:UDP-N-acetylmuramyl pentapeptide phosphotransferase/UDP-N-acetylglucosamine-1-phosphate transferase